MILLLVADLVLLLAAATACVAGVTYAGGLAEAAFLQAALGRGATADDRCAGRCHDDNHHIDQDLLEEIEEDEAHRKEKVPLLVQELKVREEIDGIWVARIMLLDL